MRGGFNKTCTFRYGSESLAGPPGGVAAADVPCRVVTQEQVFQYDFPYYYTGAWLTQDTYGVNEPNWGGVRAGVNWVNWNAADTVELSDAPGVRFVCVRGEEIDTYSGDFYVRYLLMPVSRLGPPYWIPLSLLPPAPPPVVPLTPTSSCVGAPDMPFGSICQGTQTSGAGAWYTCTSVPLGPYSVEFVTGPPGASANVYNGSCPGGFFYLGTVTPGNTLSLSNSGTSSVIWILWSGAIGSLCGFEVHA